MVASGTFSAAIFTGIRSCCGVTFRPDGQGHAPHHENRIAERWRPYKHAVCARKGQLNERYALQGSPMSSRDFVLPHVLRCGRTAVVCYINLRRGCQSEQSSAHQLKDIRIEGRASRVFLVPTSCLCGVSARQVSRKRALPIGKQP